MKDSHPNKQKHITPKTASYKQVLDMSIDDNDQALQNRFAQMRRAALDQIPEAQPTHTRSLLWPTLGGLSASLLLAVVLLTSSEHGLKNDYLLEDLDILADVDDLEMFAEYDPEFYVWLALESEKKSS